MQVFLNQTASRHRQFSAELFPPFLTTITLFNPSSSIEILMMTLRTLLGE